MGNLGHDIPSPGQIWEFQQWGVHVLSGLITGAFFWVYTRAPLLLETPVYDSEILIGCGIWSQSFIVHLVLKTPENGQSITVPNPE